MSDFKGISMPRLAAVTALVFCLGFFCGREWESRLPSEGNTLAAGSQQTAAAPMPETTLAPESAPALTQAATPAQSTAAVLAPRTADAGGEAPALRADTAGGEASSTVLAASEPPPVTPQPEQAPKPDKPVARPGSAAEELPVSPSVAEQQPARSPSDDRPALAEAALSASGVPSSGASGIALPSGPVRSGETEAGAAVAATTPPAQPRDAMPFEPSLSSVPLHKLGSEHTGPTLLVVGGIQGDEPGGFSAATVLATHYRITSGAVWVVPGLNFRSILQRNRGLFGDMNRKFASIDPDDPEYPIVREVKEIILDDSVAAVLNLHDGSGFYRPVHEDALRNPKRWGQSLIIDQATMDAPQLNHLFETAQAVEREVNRHLIAPEHRYHIHNTRTPEGNVQMEKTLSWFAVRNGKPAFGIEASKEFGTDMRAYYHLQVIEAYMRLMGIQYERDFELTPKGVLAALNTDLKVAAYDNRLVLDLENVRPSLAMIPFKKNCEPDQRSSKPLLALVPEQQAGSWRVAYGNRTLTRLHPDFMDFDDSLDAVEVLVDGKTQIVRLGGIVTVRDSFLVKGQEGYRVNAIGAKKEVRGTEADVTLVRKDFLPRFSVDKGATTYRVEVYKDKAFAGMLLVRFGEGGIAEDTPLTATSGPESDLGF